MFFTTVFRRLPAGMCVDCCHNEVVDNVRLGKESQSFKSPMESNSH